MLVNTAFVLAAIGIGEVIAQDATPVTDNPVGVAYKATLPNKPFFTNAAISDTLKGSIEATAATDGNGVQFTVNFEKLPTEGGPFTYHLHKEPATNSNCTSTLTHLDPFGRGTDPPCDLSKAQSCEVGDLSGKHGKVTTDPFYAKYFDYYASTNAASASFFGDKSFVLHYANGTRLACANFEGVDSVPSTYPTSNSTAVTSTGTATGTGGVTHTPTDPYTGSGSTNKLSLSFVYPVVMAVVLGF